MQKIKFTIKRKIVLQVVLSAGLLFLLVYLKSASPDGLERVAQNKGFSGKEIISQHSISAKPCPDWLALFFGFSLSLLLGYFAGYGINKYIKK